MKLAIIGSRDFNDYTLLCNTLAPIQHQVTHVISGGAKGADTLAEVWASEFDKELVVYLADWKKYDKAAGMIRNKDIVSSADFVYAFWDGKSPGTKNSINLCKELEVPFETIIFASETKPKTPNRLKDRLW